MKSHVKCTLNWNHVFEICHYPRSRPNLKCNKIILLSRGNSANASQCMSLKTASYAIWSRNGDYGHTRQLTFGVQCGAPIVDHWPNCRFMNDFFVFLQVLSTYILMIYGTIVLSIIFNYILIPFSNKLYVVG